jgi:elongation factor G
MPMGVEDKHAGIIDIVEMKGIQFESENLGTKFHFIDIPAEFVEEAKMWREKMMEVVCETDEKFSQKNISTVKTFQ